MDMLNIFIFNFFCNKRKIELFFIDYYRIIYYIYYTGFGISRLIKIEQVNNLSSVPLLVAIKYNKHILMT